MLKTSVSCPKAAQWILRLLVLAGTATLGLNAAPVEVVRRVESGSQALMNGIILGQVTPGPIVITATFIGYMLAGILGGIIATISIFLPSFVVLVGVAPYFDRLRSSALFNKIIGGILCSFVGLLLATAIRFALDVPWDVYHIALSLGALVALLLKVDILWVVLAGAALSVIMAL